MIYAKSRLEETERWKHGDKLDTAWGDTAPPGGLYVGEIRFGGKLDIVSGQFECALGREILRHV